MLATVTSAAVMAHESAPDPFPVSIEVTAHGGASATIEASEPPVAVAIPASTSAPATEPAKTLDLSPYGPGTIVVHTSERKLHLVLAPGEVVTYPVGVGKAGKAWSGTAYIRGKYHPAGVGAAEGAEA